MSVLSSVYGLCTARQVWNHLTQRFVSQSRSHVTHLKRQLQSLNQGTKTCSEYLQVAKTWSDQLAAVKKPVDEDDLISFVISGLNSTFQSFVTSYSFLTRDKELTFDEFQTELLNFEMMVNIHRQQNEPEVGNFALYSQKSKNSNFRGNSSSKFSKPNQSQMQSFRPHGPHQKQNPQQRSNLASSSNFLSKPPCQICGKNGHQALDCFHRMDFAYQGRHPPSQLAAMVAKTSSNGDQTWLADSAANNHITDDMNNLQISAPYQGGDEVAVGNGSGLSISHIGSFVISQSSSQINLKSVLYCPTAAANLLSIQKFCKDNNCCFKLTSAYFVVKDNLSGRTLLQGPSRNGLYPIRLPTSNNKARAFVAFLGVSTDASVWHARLGHPASRVLQLLSTQFHLPVKGNINKSPVCISCQKAKSKRLSFPVSTRISMFPLELIHYDLWCSPISSISGCKFYIIFIDDFSRFSWMFPLHSKSDAYIAFVKFKCFAENQFSTKIKNFQSDGGGEFTSHQFKKFLETNGIMHRISCPYTSQQNGIAERKHRHLVETGLALLAQSHLSNTYWVEAFNTAIYLINRLPTTVLNDQSPFHVLLKQIPNYSLLRTFGCACYPLLRPYINHKLMFRSKQCIFLGYSSNHKGYRCLDPLTNRVYLSRHVVFDESVFPAKDTNHVLHQSSATATAPMSDCSSSSAAL
jgi:hypothetical protein